MRRIATASALLAALPAAAAQFDFVVLGDMPYGDPSEVYAPYETLIRTVNAEEPAIVIHVGDTKSGSTECSDGMLDDQLRFLNDFAAPTLYTPGDNEWTDCHRGNAGGFDPLDRLDRIRSTYFSQPGTSFGSEQIEVTHQGAAGYPENARVMLNDVMFVTAHVVGSNNNFETRDLAAIEEFMARDSATVTWLQDSFAEAGDAAAVVVAIHADMFESGFDEESWVRHSGFNSFGPALVAEAAAFGKPVLLVYGDSHYFRQSRPFTDSAPNLNAVMVPGSSEMHAVKVTADTEAAGVFSLDLLMNPALSN